MTTSVSSSPRSRHVRGFLEHQTKGRVSIQTVAGHILVRAEGRTFDLPAGTLLALDQNLPHDVEALEESAFLITIAWPHGDRQGSAGELAASSPDETP